MDIKNKIANKLQTASSKTKSVLILSDKSHATLSKSIIIDERGRAVTCSCLHLMKIFVIDIVKISTNIFRETFTKCYNMKKLS